jgi:hypothetical protein
MVWRDLLDHDENIIAPWLGGRSLRTFSRAWEIKGRLPPSYGWYIFNLSGRKARWNDGVILPAEPPVGSLRGLTAGYLVGDRLIADDVSVELGARNLASVGEKVWLIDPGLDRFTRITAGRFYDDGPLIYEGPGFPLGPEDEVLQAFLDQKDSVDDIHGVVPALEMAFRFESWIRAEAEKRRQEELERQRLEAEIRAREERRQRIIQELGDSAGRRELSVTDFEEAARAALRVGGAEFLDYRRSPQRNERIVRFRLENRRFECTCDVRTLRIIEAGICLTDERSGRRDDHLLTLESLPSSIREAMRAGVLVVFRHVD